MEKADWKKCSAFVLTKCEGEVKSSEYINTIKQKLSIDISEKNIVCVDIDDKSNTFKTGDKAIKDLIDNISMNNKNVFISTQKASKLNICSVLFQSMQSYATGDEIDQLLVNHEGQQNEYMEMMNCIKEIDNGAISHKFAGNFETVMSG